MAVGNGGRTYGVGPAAYKMNVGPNQGVNAIMAADGSVKVAGTTTYDPAVNGVEVQQADPTIDYAGEVL